MASAGGGVAARALPAAATRTRRRSRWSATGASLRGQLSRLSSGGAVLTLDDVTELAHAQRVLAWGEMARQVAHEIKNPLTPIRLGVQHLRRARGRPDFDDVLEQNVSRILTEIDRLDEIARSFSRYGTRAGGTRARRADGRRGDRARRRRAREARRRRGAMDVRGGWRRRPLALARGDELREVLLNLFENARLAHASAVDGARARRLHGGRRASGADRRDATTAAASPPTCCRASSSRTSRRARAAAGSGSRSPAGWWRAGAAR